MEITDEIKSGNEVFDDEKQEDIFYSLLNGKTVKETIETSRGKFVVKYPKQKDLMYIDRRIAAMRGGLPASSFDDMANFAMQKVAYLDVVVESGEPWFNNVKEKNKSFSWLVCMMRPDTDNPAPAMMAANTRGMRMFQIIRTWAALPFFRRAFTQSPKLI